MINYDKRLQEVEQKYVQQILDKEIEALQMQRRELEEQLKHYNNSKFRTNLKLGFVPKSNIFKRK